MSKMSMYDDLKCPEEQTTVSSSEITTVEMSSTMTEESRPEVIIKNPQKMLEDVFSNIDDTNMELDSNRLDFADAKKELDLMLGDQPVADTPEDKKGFLKLTEKKEVFPKKSKSSKEQKMKKIDEDEPMMGDAPAEEVPAEQSTTLSSKPEGSTTDRQRRDVSETTVPIDDTKVSTESFSSTQDATGEDLTTVELTTTEAPPMTTTIIEETTTKNIVHGHPLFHNHAVFKEPISMDNNNGSLERKDVSNTDDHFIPPMLLVKARFTATKSTEGATEETKEMITDITTSMVTESTADGQTVTEDEKNETTTAKPTQSNEIVANEISSLDHLETTPVLQTTVSEEPIVIEKRNDPRMGLHVATTTTTTETATEVQSPSTTEELPTSVSEEFTTYESSSVSDVSSTDAQTEISETSEGLLSEVSPTKMFDSFTSTQPDSTAERLIESTTERVETTSLAFSTRISFRFTTLKVPEVTTGRPMKPRKEMRNDIDGNHESNEGSADSLEHHERFENNLNNENNYQPYKPNRHRSIADSGHHHGPGFSIGKILG